MKRNNLSDLIDRANLIHNNSYNYSLITEYQSMHDKMNIICPKHGLFTISLHSHINKKRGCKYCAIERVTDTKEKFIDKAIKIHGVKYDYDKVDYTTCRKKVIINCPIHGDFEQKPRDHINAKQGCPICSESKGEKKIRVFLKKSNITFEKEKKFDDLKYKSFLYFDFYLPDYNVCIEYDGAQHFNSYDIFGGEKNYNDIKIKDSLKNKYCEINKMKLLRISYLEKNIENLINNFLKL